VSWENAFVSPRDWKERIQDILEAISKKSPAPEGYGTVLEGMAELLGCARRAASHTINNVMAATYWEIGRKIVEFEQNRKEPGEVLGTFA
jgi:hypothetical protein